MFDPNTSKLNVDWHEKVKEQERGFTFENRYARLDWKEKDGDIDFLSESSDKEESTEEAVDWIAFKNQFFSAVMISKDAFDKGKPTSTALLTTRRARRTTLSGTLRTSPPRLKPALIRQDRSPASSSSTSVLTTFTFSRT